jgi:hypothetical protein
MFAAADLERAEPVAIPAPLPIRIWPATRRADATTTLTRELAL